jgi:hypothetical protein
LFLRGARPELNAPLAPDFFGPSFPRVSVISSDGKVRCALKAFFVAGAGAAAFLLFLAVERLVLDTRLKGIPVRVGVTGTRGKSWRGRCGCG